MITKSRRGFTLIELLCVAAALCVLGGAVAVAFMGDGDERRIVREEAENLCAWLTANMAFAAREGVTFKLEPSMYQSDNIIVIEWFNGSRDATYEIYKTERADLGRVSTATEHTFSGKWFTLTPAASFIIRSHKDSSIRLVVTVSGVGYADIKESL